MKQDPKVVISRMRNKHGTPVLSIKRDGKTLLRVMNPGTDVNGYIARAFGAANA